MVTIVDAVLLLILFFSSYRSTTVVVDFSTKAFILGAVLCGAGAAMGIGISETKEEASLANVGIETGPEIALDRVKERPQMRERQLSQGAVVMLVGAPILIISFLMVPFY